MIQDIQPYRYDNTYRPGKPEKEDFLLCYEGKKAFLKKEEEGIRFPTFREAEKAWKRIGISSMRERYIFLPLTA